MNTTLQVLLVALALPLQSCSSDKKENADLPAGWEEAQPIRVFHQAECSGSPYDPATVESMHARGEARALVVTHHNAHFRCAQVVEGFVLAGEGRQDVLVQPVDMNPSSVAKCDCSYELTMQLDVEPGDYVVRVSRRWDHLSGSDGVTLVGSTAVRACAPDESCTSSPDGGAD